MSQLSPSSVRNARWGLWLFALYLIFYAGFIGLNAYSIEAMAAPGWGGVNIAIWYGLGLILAAFALAVVYLYHAKDDHEEAQS